MIKIQCFDYDSTSANDLIGEAYLSVSDLWAHKITKQWFNMMYEKKVSGKIEIQFEYQENHHTVDPSPLAPTAPSGPYPSGPLPGAHDSSGFGGSYPGFTPPPAGYPGYAPAPYPGGYPGYPPAPAPGGFAPAPYPYYPPPAGPGYGYPPAPAPGGFAPAPAPGGYPAPAPGGYPPAPAPGGYPSAPGYPGGWGGH